MYKTMFIIDPENYKEVHPIFPKFIIAFGGPLFEWQSFIYKEKLYSEDGSVIGVDSCHLYGTSDPYKADFNAHKVYKEHTIINYDDSHKFPRDLKDEEFSALK